MSLPLRLPIPSQVAILLAPFRQDEIAAAGLRAWQRIARRKHIAENAARALQWSESQADLHVRTHACPEQCATLRSFRRQIKKRRSAYQDALRQLRKGR